MPRRLLRVLGLPFASLLPLATACTGEAVPIDTTGSTADPDTGSDSSTGDPDTSGGSTSTSTTMDPDTSTSTTTDAESSETTDPTTSTTGFEGCGDGFVDAAAGELCDGNNLDGRDCISEDFGGGVLACNPDCTLDTSGCTYECGDDEVQGDEQCEGNDLDGNDCVSIGFDGGDLGCNADCTFDTTACENYDCGDNVRAGPEVCDGADLDGESCSSLDFDSGTLSCLADCSGFDTSDCFVCGDGVINGTEECDGVALGGETCVSQGLEGGVISCSNACTLDLSECVGCGNGDADPGEQCDTDDLGGFTCAGLGFPDGGQPTCLSDCTISDLSCAGLHTFCTSPASAIGPGGNVQTLSNIAVAGLDGEIVDIDVLVVADHTRVSDLDIDVRHVDTNTSVSLADDQCGVANDVDATFDQDAGGAPDCIEPIAIQGNVLPLGNLDNYVENDMVGPGNGTWELSIVDQVANEGGTLDQWCVAITTGNVDCGNGLLEPDEMCDDLLAPPWMNASCTECLYDFSALPQLYCNGTCTWAGADSCDQADADIYCKLITGNPDSVATDFEIGVALDEPGFSCPSIGENLGPIPGYGVDVDVWYQDTSILQNHGAGSVIVNAVCN